MELLDLGSKKIEKHEIEIQTEVSLLKVSHFLEGLRIRERQLDYSGCTLSRTLASQLEQVKRAVHTDKFQAMKQLFWDVYSSYQHKSLPENLVRRFGGEGISSQLQSENFNVFILVL